MSKPSDGGVPRGYRVIAHTKTNCPSCDAPTYCEDCWICKCGYVKPEHRRSRSGDAQVVVVPRPIRGVHAVVICADCNWNKLLCCSDATCSVWHDGGWVNLGVAAWERHECGGEGHIDVDVDVGDEPEEGE